VRYTDPTGYDAGEQGPDGYNVLGETFTPAAAVYFEVITTVMWSPEYLPGYPLADQIARGTPAVPGAVLGNTWCQAYANSTMTAMGASTAAVLTDSPRTGKPDIDYTDANQMATNAHKAAADPESGGKQLTGEQAQERANAGAPVIAVAESSKPGVPGHAGVVAPDLGPYHADRGPTIAQTGSNPGVRSAYDSFNAVGLEPRYYELTSSPQRP
jgi:hypothetical protein